MIKNKNGKDDLKPTRRQNKFLLTLDRKEFGEGWNGYGYSDNVRVYDLTEDQRAEYDRIGHILSKKATKPAKPLALRRLGKMFPEGDIAVRIFSEYESNKETGGKAWKLLASAEDADEVLQIFGMMRAARQRHEDTDYDSLLSAGLSQDQARAMKSEINL